MATFPAKRWLINLCAKRCVLGSRILKARVYRHSTCSSAHTEHKGFWGLQACRGPVLHFLHVFPKCTSSEFTPRLADSPAPNLLPALYFLPSAIRMLNHRNFAYIYVPANFRDLFTSSSPRTAPARGTLSGRVC